MIVPIQGLLDAASARQYRDLAVQGEWQNGKATAGGLAQRVKSNRQLLASSKTAQELGDRLLGVLGRHPLFVSAALPRRIFRPGFNCYQKGESYGLHVDSAIMHLPDNTVMRTDLSATLFLCDPHEYEGGELCIETQYGAQQVKLNAGDMILYPSTSLHEVRPVTAGARICAFFWVESLVRDNKLRELLFDLDQSIQQLTVERGNEDTEVRRLSGIYHNLLRTWAST